MRIGSVERWTDTAIVGWVRDPNGNGQPPVVRLSEGGEVIGEVVADIEREDLVDRSKVNGSDPGIYGFRLPIPRHLLNRRRHVLEVSAADIPGGEIDGGMLEYENKSVPFSHDDFADYLSRLSRSVENMTDLDELIDHLAPVGTAFAALMGRLNELRRLEKTEWSADNALEVASAISDEFAELRSQVLDTYPRLSLATSHAPMVSVVIPVFQKFSVTYKCLKSFSDHPPTVPFEIIVVDDCSFDETLWTSAVAPDVNYIRQSKNAGFVTSCNTGLAAARGEYVYFLNNDTEIQPDTIEALLRVFEEKPDAGLVGSKLLYPDGSLQEAGGIIFRDGSGWNFGRSDDEKRPEYNYLRKADYVSGAAILLRRDFLEELGGFDTHYVPAYYEDTDLAFRVRQAGRHVYYQPASRVIHYEGVSSGTSTTGGGMKRFQVINGRKFYQRWRDVLRAHGENGKDVILQKDRYATDQLLFIDSTTLTPKEDAGSNAAWSHIKAFLEMGWHVTFVPAHNMADLGETTDAMRELGCEVLHHPYYPSLEDVLRRRNKEFHTVYIHRFQNASRYLDLVRTYRPDARIIYNVADLHFWRVERERALKAEAEGRAIAADPQWEAAKAAELACIEKSDVTIVHSSAEKAYLRSLKCRTGHIQVMPWAMDAEPTTTPFEDRSNIMFVGGYGHPPNIDAVLWFCREMWPELRAKLGGDVEFWVVGSKAPKEEFADLGEGVRVLGWVDDLRELYDQVRLTIAPLRYGAGLKGKVLESVIYGVPVVGTPIAWEGLLDDPPPFSVEEIARTYAEEAAWQAALDQAKASKAIWTADDVRNAFKKIVDTLEAKKESAA